MRTTKTALWLMATVALMTACQSEPKTTLSGLEADNFVAEYNGKTTALYTLTNANGVEVCITNFGGRIVSVLVPDRDGVMQDVVLGFDNVNDYATIPTDFGATIGRYANRLNKGLITVDGVEYQLDTNNYGHTLHGGPTGWQYQVYDRVEQPSDTVLILGLTSPDGDNGFPGEVKASVTFTLTADNALRMQYEATTSATTVINMTNHTYFNLSGNGNNAITDDLLWLNATAMTPVDNTFMTTGEITDIAAGDPFDFYTAPKAIGQDIEAENEQLANGKGYDHNFVLCAPVAEGLNHAASLFSPASGIELQVWTNEPGIQVYTGNFLDGTVTGKRGEVYGLRHAVCLETQKYPDTPNKPEWPSAILRAGETYSSVTEFRFATR